MCHALILVIHIIGNCHFFCLFVYFLTCQNVPGNLLVAKLCDPGTTALVTAGLKPCFICLPSSLNCKEGLKMTQTQSLIKMCWIYVNQLANIKVFTTSDSHSSFSTFARRVLTTPQYCIVLRMRGPAAHVHSKYLMHYHMWEIPAAWVISQKQRR